MLKRLNTMLISFVLTLGIITPVGYFLYLPIYFIYLLKDNKNYCYFTIPSILSAGFFLKEYLIIHLVIIGFTLILIRVIKHLVIKNKINNNLLNIIVIIFLLIVNMVNISVIKTDSNNKILNICLMVIMVLSYLYLNRSVIKTLTTSKKVKERLQCLDFDICNSYIWYEMLIVIFSIVTLVNLKVDNIFYFSLVYCSYFTIYFSRKYQNIICLFFGLVATFINYLFLKDISVIIIMFGSSIYMVKSIYTFGIYNLLLAIISINNTNIMLYATLMTVSIIFEIIYKHILNNKSVNSYDIKQSIVKNTNKEILEFAGFLDMFVRRFKQSVSLNEKINQGLNLMIQNHCNNCAKKTDCFNKYQRQLYNNLKQILLQENIDLLDTEFEQYCIQFSKLLNTSKLLKYQIDFSAISNDAQDANNYMLLSQISGVSMALKNYVIDKIAKEEIEFEIFEKSKRYLYDLDYEVTYFEVKRYWVEDFLIFVGIKNITYEEMVKTLTALYEELLHNKVSVIFCKKENNTIYVNIVPHILLDITYAYGAIPSTGEEISGDNYLIKENENGHMIFAISDGMGKGYKAFYESDMTINLIEEITSLSIASSTALSILNSFYSVQDYLERYATLDYLDISRYSKIATFYKMGSTSTYIYKKSGAVQKVINKSLPLGLDEEIDQTEILLEDGDLIIMSSDGILENVVNENDFNKIIKDSYNLIPQKLIHKIFDYVINNKLKSEDDMTLFVIKVQEKTVNT